MDNGLNFPDNFMAIFGFKRKEIKNMSDQKKWDLRFLSLAKEISTWSKDPSTKVGCVIVDRNKRVVSLGYNGFAQRVNDSEERYSNREIKYKMVLHSEINAIIFAQKDLTNYTIYTYPMPPCSQCAAAIIQSGIKRIVAIEPTNEQVDRWGEDFQLSLKMYEECSIESFFFYKKEEIKKDFNLSKLTHEVAEDAFVGYTKKIIDNCSGKCKCKK